MKHSYMSAKSATAGMCIVFAAVAGGCTNAGHQLAIGGETNNPSKIDSPEEFEAKVKKIENGMDKASAFGACGIDEKLFTLLPTDEAMKAVFGNAVPHPSSDEEMRKIAATLEKIEVYTLPYKDISKFGSIDWKGETTERRVGFDRTLTVVFQENAVHRAFITGSPTVDDTKRKNVLWESGPGFVGKVIGVN
jgi:hypothetical protein